MSTFDKYKASCSDVELSNGKVYYPEYFIREVIEEIENMAYGEGYNDAVKEAREEIHKNYTPNKVR